MRLLLGILASLLLIGCDGHPDTDNGRVHVHNHTDQPIELRYLQEHADCCGHWADARRTIIAPQSDLYIYVDSHLWDGHLTAVRDGIHLGFDLDFDIWGTDSVHIYEHHFPPIADG